MAKVLVVGAGPVGLTCAIELVRQKHDVIIIEQNATREHISKAIGINAKTLQLLEASDVSPRLVAAGIPIQKVHLHYSPQKEICINLKKLPSRYNFMLSLPQDKTEEILEHRLNELGIKVQRETQLKQLHQSNDKVTATIETVGKTQEITVDFLVGADGAHSIVRKQLGQEFVGVTYPERWNLADVRMDWKYDAKDGHGFITAPGLIGVVLPIGPDRYRLVANHPNALDILPKPYNIHEIIWQSDFSINCRVVKNYQVGRVFLAGDAAHIHTPVGGRGMNLGMEDVCVLARLLTEGGWENYNKLRHPIGKKVVHMTSQFYNVFALKNPLAIKLRNCILFPLMRLPFVQKKQVKEIVGL
jgi:2-polyprenyl-6-methoxyphenol hydroxylase-like FAD-dependent oxidoreductase